MPISSISAPARFTFDGIMLKFSIGSLIIQSFTPDSPKISSYTVFSSDSLSTPRPLVVFPCGSMSIVRTFLPFSARHADKLIAVVDLPTPPFWFAIAIIRSTLYSFFVLFLCHHPSITPWTCNIYKKCFT